MLFSLYCTFVLPLPPRTPAAPFSGGVDHSGSTEPIPRKYPNQGFCFLHLVEQLTVAVLTRSLCRSRAKVFGISRIRVSRFYRGGRAGRKGSLPGQESTSQQPPLSPRAPQREADCSWSTPTQRPSQLARKGHLKLERKVMAYGTSKGRTEHSCT